VFRDSKAGGRRLWGANWQSGRKWQLAEAAAMTLPRNRMDVGNSHGRGGSVGSEFVRCEALRMDDQVSRDEVERILI
jgi:hypothetical protein